MEGLLSDNQFQGKEAGSFFHSDLLYAQQTV